MGKKNMLNIDEPPLTPLKNDAIPNTMFPILERKFYPEANRKAIFPEGTFFLFSDTYVVDRYNNVGYKDNLSGDTIYLNRMDTVLHRQEIAKVVESVGKSLIPSTRGCDAINFNNLQWGVISDPDNRMKAAYLSGKQGIFLNLNNESGISINIYELQSTFRHELLHFVDAEKWDHYPKKGRFSYADHADIYLEQMQYPEFLKASVEFQLDIVKNYYLYIWNHFYQNGKNLDRFKNAVDAFNNGIGEKFNMRIKPEKIEIVCPQNGEPTEFFSIIHGKNEEHYTTNFMEKPI